MSSLVIVSHLLASLTLASSLDLSQLPEDGTLAQLLWENVPELRMEHGQVQGARAEEARSHLLPNPSLDLSWNTIPVGPTNPPGISPLRDVPNYSVGLSQTVELFKRGPRQQAFHAATNAAMYTAQSLLWDRFFALQSQIADVAAGETRIAALKDLAADAAQLRRIERTRAEKGDTSELDADRALLEEEKWNAALIAQQEQLAADLRQCATLAGVRCTPFGSLEKAVAFLSRRPAGNASQGVESRPDVQSLEAQQKSAESNLTLAHRKWLGDPTFRVGYLRDTFVISGNQPHSVFVGVSFPLPFFDHGQADAQAAQAQKASAEQAKAQLTRQAHRELDRLDEQMTSVDHRREVLKTKTLPLAKSVEDRLEAAVQRGAVPVQELLLARRTLGEILLSAGELERDAYKLSIARAQVLGKGPAVPSELQPAVLR